MTTSNPSYTTPWDIISEETLSNTYAPHGGAKTEMFNQMTLLKANIE